MLYMILALLTMILLINAQRRLTNSEPLPKPKPYVVYLTKAKSSPEPYDEWICGGVIVTPNFIVTAAACVQDVRYIYAIAGYEKYVEHDKINLDPCTKVAKKKVVFTAVPKKYKFIYNDTEHWTSIDIAVAKVESPYNFEEKLGPKCSYKPQSIPVNFDDPQLQSPGTHAFMLGWGHREVWRQKGDPKNYNNKTLQYGTTVVKSKESCKSAFGDMKKLHKIIDNDNMICTFGDGKFDSEGRRINRGSRRKLNSGNNETIILHSTRRSGICQNDHGGPLVVRVASQDILIGVASLFVVEDSKCSEPFFYTSTYSNAKFLFCIIVDLHNDTTFRSSYTSLRTGTGKSFEMFKCQSTLEDATYYEIMKEKVRRQIEVENGSTQVTNTDEQNVGRKSDHQVRRRPQIPMNMLRQVQSPVNRPSSYLEILQRPADYVGPEDD